MPITASALRANVHRSVDEVIETGKPVEVTRKRAVVKLVPEKKVSKRPGGNAGARRRARG